MLDGLNDAEGTICFLSSELGKMRGALENVRDLLTQRVDFHRIHTAELRATILSLCTAINDPNATLESLRISARDCVRHATESMEDAETRMRERGFIR